MEIRTASEDDLPALLAIYNHAVATLTATFDLEEQSLGQRREWFREHVGSYPLIVAVIEGCVVGYCSLSRFRSKPGYSRTAESSVYIHPDFQGRGIGLALMQEIVRRAGLLGYRTIVAGIVGGNEASVRLHVSLGFAYIGRFREVGRKFGEWQDVDWYQLMLERAPA